MVIDSNGEILIHTKSEIQISCLVTYSIQYISIIHFFNYPYYFYLSPRQQ